MIMRVVELSAETWPALEELFGPRGADGGCWCMFFRLPGPEFRVNTHAPNRAALRRWPQAPSRSGCSP
jgi:hypothetical protein